MNDVDNLFRKNVSEMKSLPAEVKWKKEKGWQKLKKKQKKHQLIGWMKYAAAVVVLISVGYVFLKPEPINNKMVDDAAKYEQEKQLLEEMNKKLGIIGEVKYVCENCINSDYYIEYREYRITSSDEIY